jgi:hypothetical protein
MSLIATSPMLMSKFLYILKRKYSHDETQFEAIKKHCSPFPHFYVYAQFTSQDPQDSKSYGMVVNIPEDEILKHQIDQEKVEHEPWSKCLYSDDIDITSLLYKRVVDNLREAYSNKIGSFRFGIKGTYQNPLLSDAVWEDLMHQNLYVNKNINTNKDAERISDSKQ